MNDVAVSNQLLNIKRFTDQVPFSKLSNFKRVNVSIPNGDGYAMQSDQLTYGWVVNPKTDVAGDPVSISTMPDGKYKLRLFLTWRGAFLDEQEVTASNGTIQFNVPMLKTTGGHANYTGPDIAFLLERIPEKPVVTPPVKKKKNK